MPDLTLLTSPEQMQEWSRQTMGRGESIGLVPTMGALHEGHRSLVERCATENDATVVSIFVNPTQFGPGEDFQDYPRTLEQDHALCDQAGAEAIYLPSHESMYDEDHRTWVEVGGLADNLCGLSRPGHFRGVATVVAKLLTAVRPDRAYFGEKDAQQLRIIEVMVRDLNLGCEVVPCPIVREFDGVAMSSRNRYLSAGERKQAPWLYKALQQAQADLKKGERNALTVIAAMTETIDKHTEGEIDYIALVDAATLEDLVTLAPGQDILIALAVKIGPARLIDNVRMTVG